VLVAPGKPASFRNSRPHHRREPGFFMHPLPFCACARATSASCKNRQAGPGRVYLAVRARLLPHLILKSLNLLATANEWDKSRTLDALIQDEHGSICIHGGTVKREHSH
jgi:hypothetical protein